jgi:L-ascorbate metabolism protein UlaG (beta-lactamase superfamily)
MRGLLVVALAASCGSPANPASDAAPDSAPEPVLKLEYVAHACFRMRGPEGTSVLIDPFASRVWLGYDFPDEYLDVDAALITHPHYDHDKGEFIGRPSPWTSGQMVLRDPGEVSIGEFSLRGVAGKHADPWGMEFDQKNTIWVVEVAGLRLVHLGDNGPLSQQAAQEIGTVDVLLAPMDGNEHILKMAELDVIRQQLQPSVTIPMHYRLPDLERDPDSPEDLGPIDPWLAVQEHVRELDGNALQLSPGRLPDEKEVWVLAHATW